MRSFSCVIGLCALTVTWPGGVSADAAVIAAATNFSEVLERLEAEFERNGEHELTIVTGSTGLLYAQITRGAPFDAFLAADQLRPGLLEDAGAIVQGSRFSYAIGRLVLWSPDANRVGNDGAKTLRQQDFRRLAMANPALAPYGVAARETLEALEVYHPLRDRIVIGENAGQAWAMVATGNAELGLVALSSVLSPRNPTPGSRWIVPQELHAPLRQDAVLLQRGDGNVAAQAFLDWLRQAPAINLIRQFGYGVE